MKNIITKTLTVATVGAVMALEHGSGHGGTDPGGRRHRRWSRRNDFQVLGPDGKFVGQSVTACSAMAASTRSTA